MRWVAFPLHPDTPEEGRRLETLFAGRGIDVAQMVAHLKRTARDLGLPFGDRTMTYNSRKAQELGKWAEARGRGEQFHLNVFQAYFVQGHNIARTQVLKSLAEQTGLDGEKAQQVLIEGRYQKAVDQDWRRSRQMGVSAVPSFNLRGRIMVGAQSYTILRQFVTDSGIDPKHRT